MIEPYVSVLIGKFFKKVLMKIFIVFTSKKRNRRNTFRSHSVSLRTLSLTRNRYFLNFKTKPNQLKKF